MSPKSSSSQSWVLVGRGITSDIRRGGGDELPGGPVWATDVRQVVADARRFHPFVRITHRGARRCWSSFPSRCVGQRREEREHVRSEPVSQSAGCDSGALERVCAAVCVWLDDRREMIASEIFERLVVEVDAYRDEAGDPAQRQRVGRSVSAIVGLSLEVLRERRRLGDDETALIEDLGARRAAEQFDLHQVQEGIHVAVRAGMRHLFAAIGAGPKRQPVWDAAGELCGVLLDFEYDLQRAVEAGYRRGYEEAVASRLRARAAVLHQVLERAPTAEETEAAASVLDVCRDASVIVVVIARGDGDAGESLAAPAVELVRSIGAGVQGPVFFSLPRSHAVVLAWPEADADVSLYAELAGRAQELRLRVLVERVPELALAHRACRELRDLLDVAVCDARPALSTRKDLLHLRVIGGGNVDEELDYVRLVLGGSMACNDGYALARLDRLRAVYDSPDGQVKQAARMLAAHENTVRYNVGRIGELTGLHYLHDRFRLELALRLFDRHRATLPPPGDPWWERS